MRLTFSVLLLAVATVVTAPVLSKAPIVAAEASVAEVQAFFEYLREKSAKEAASTASRELSTASIVRTLYAGGSYTGLDDQLSPVDRNVLANESIKYTAELNDIGTRQDADICLEVSGKPASDVDLDRLNAIQQRADAEVEALGQESFERTLDRLTHEGKGLVATHLSQLTEGNWSVVMREELDLGALAPHKKAVVYLAQRKCLEATLRKEIE